ncbi:uncharacterized protein [Rutidosis leptorrhynchoides]|uniref:uncharacterized protein n=1 Tax=Rutidosis leptorrhynchoides TaxID=125765 RepID=UPI003A99414E
MFSALKSLPIQTKPAATVFSSTANKFTGPIIGTVRFQQASAGKGEADHSMEKDKKKNEEAQKVHKKGDVMSDSFGEGYATRSDEEGFGGIYGRNQSLSHDDEDKIVHGNSPEYDKTQGCEVKEKEKARNQTQA